MNADREALGCGASASVAVYQSWRLGSCILLSGLPEYVSA